MITGMVEEEVSASEAQSKKAAKKLAAKAEKAAKVSFILHSTKTIFQKHFLFRKLNTRPANKLKTKMPKMPVKTSRKENMDLLK